MMWWFENVGKSNYHKKPSKKYILAPVDGEGYLALTLMTLFSLRAVAKWTKVVEVGII